ncbi:DNA repair photolyase [Natronospira proteinivora]|uniref:DNA repair photolyase n=1 Tax=Natronospira proteinivora TaxID=1807133 RepID=A0ABT1G6J1_9GAMM|nr:PA0069 family radical SAM protein [Natronospira proteinivora]MCP1726906.1 DNA repair photolyase [Natronospira proteinivora]
MAASQSRHSTKGRGTGINPVPRYRIQRHEPVDDGWWRGDEPAPQTCVLPDPARRVISYNRSPDVPFDRSINPYRGCEHGCIYCFARPSHAYLDLSPGLDFETRLFAKIGAADCLEAELRAPGYRCAPLVLGANTDCYQPIEKQYRITRELLERLAEFRHPVSILTKSSLILRDRDILRELARDNLVNVMVSVTTLDTDLKRRLEPRTPSGERRLATVTALHEAGIPTGVLLAPVIPHINDAEIETIVARAAAAGARSVASVLLRLPHELSALFRDWLGTHYPDRAQRVMNTLQACRGGKDNDSRFGRRMTGEGPYAQLISQRLTLARRRHGLLHRRFHRLNTAAFVCPRRHGDQLNLI